MSQQILATNALHHPTDRSSIDLDIISRMAHIQEILEQLDHELMGLESVKTRLREIIALLLVDRARQGLGLTSGITSLHMCFTGHFGSSMTEVAARMAEILYRLGYLPKGHSVVATYDELVGQTVGQTITKTEEILVQATGGVLLIDGAYFLLRPSDGRDLGLEALVTLLKAMDTQRDLIVILAGDKANCVEQLINSKLGISMISHHIDVPQHTHNELLAIARTILKAQHYRLGLGAELALRDYLFKRALMSRLTNIQTVRDALAQVQLQQANRLLAKTSVSKRDLMTIEAEDILILTDQWFRKTLSTGIG